MYGITLAHAISLGPPSQGRTIKVFSLVGITAILSWPFAGALAIVFLFHDFAQIGINGYQFLKHVHALLFAGAISVTALVNPPTTILRVT
jgi:hypothetical protein